MNPWENINLDIYEKHMCLESVYQLQALNEMMKEQFESYDIDSIMILGIAGGNGLEHIDTQKVKKVYGVDVNAGYLYECEKRYPQLNAVLETIHTDLLLCDNTLPYADLLVANLLIEYIGYDCFTKVVQQIKPKYVSIIIQINSDDSFVSDSPYLHAFDGLNQVHYQMEYHAMVDTMKNLQYTKIQEEERQLPNGKKLVRIDFK